MKKIYYGKAVYDSKEINAVTKVLKNEGLSLVDGKNVKNLRRLLVKCLEKNMDLWLTLVPQRIYLDYRLLISKRFGDYYPESDIFNYYSPNISIGINSTFYRS